MMNNCEWLKSLLNEDEAIATLSQLIDSDFSE